MGRVNGVVDIFFINWIDRYSIGRDPLIYILQGDIISVENIFHTLFISFS